MNYRDITLEMASICSETACFIQNEQKTFKQENIEFKGQNNLVSYVDKKAEEMLISKLEKILPDAGILAEESAQMRPENDRCWIIDPLDGTTNFIHGVPVYSISVALMHRGEIVSGVVHEINLNESFTASKGDVSQLNGRPIQTSLSNNMEDGLFATGFPYSDHLLPKEYLQVIAHIQRISRGIRRLGSAAVDLAYVAAGRFDGFFEYGLNAWDVAAGMLIVRQAGGVVSDFKGGDDCLFGRQIVAANKNIHPTLLNQIISVRDHPI